jgi:hypothetical protein
MKTKAKRIKSGNGAQAWQKQSASMNVSGSGRTGEENDMVASRREERNESWRVAAW